MLSLSKEDSGIARSLGCPQNCRAETSSIGLGKLLRCSCSKSEMDELESVSVSGCQQGAGSHSQRDLGGTGLDGQLPECCFTKVKPDMAEAERVRAKPSCEESQAAPKHQVTFQPAYALKYGETCRVAAAVLCVSH